MIVEGNVVRSVAGHDADRFYIVLSVEGDFALIADGKKRLLEKPKRKRLKHLKKTNTVIDITTILNDKQLRKALHQFNYGDNADEGGIQHG